MSKAKQERRLLIEIWIAWMRHGLIKITYLVCEWPIHVFRLLLCSRSMKYDSAIKSLNTRALILCTTFFLRALSLVHTSSTTVWSEASGKKMAFQTTATINNIATVKKSTDNSAVLSLCDVLIFTHILSKLKCRSVSQANAGTIKIGHKRHPPFATSFRSRISFSVSVSFVCHNDID